MRAALAALAFLALASCSSERAALPSTACSIDAIEGAGGDPPAAPVGAKLTFVGWAADLKAKRVGSEVVLWLVAPNGFIVASAKRSQHVGRPDVADHFKIPEIANAGFHAPLDTAGLPKGTYEIMVESRFDIYSIACRGTRTLSLH